MRTWNAFEQLILRGAEYSAGMAAVARVLGHCYSLTVDNYDYRRIHQTLRISPAMEAGIADHSWSKEGLVGLTHGTLAHWISKWSPGMNRVSYLHSPGDSYLAGFVVTTMDLPDFTVRDRPIVGFWNI